MIMERRSRNYILEMIFSSAVGGLLYSLQLMSARLTAIFGASYLLHKSAV